MVVNQVFGDYVIAFKALGVQGLHVCYFVEKILRMILYIYISYEAHPPLP